MSTLSCRLIPGSWKVSYHIALVLLELNEDFILLSDHTDVFCWPRIRDGEFQLSWIRLLIGFQNTGPRMPGVMAASSGLCVWCDIPNFGNVRSCVVAKAFSDAVHISLVFPTVAVSGQCVRRASVQGDICRRTEQICGCGRQIQGNVDDCLGVSLRHHRNTYFRRGVTQTNPCACQAFTQTSRCACQAFVLTVVGRFLFSGARPRHSQGSQGAVRAAQAERRQGLAGDAGRGAALFSAGSCADGGEDRFSPSLPTDNLTYSPIDSPTDRLSDRPTDSPTDRQSDRPTVRPTNRLTVRQSNRPTDQLTLRLTVRPTDRLTDHPTVSPTDRPTDRPTVSHFFLGC